jgi:hypothetical protein
LRDEQGAAELLGKCCKENERLMPLCQLRQQTPDFRSATLNLILA